MTLADLDGDGRQEIIASGVDNGYYQATLVVLDQDKVSGASLETVRPQIQIHGMGVAHERYRLLFPRSDLNMATLPYNAGGEVAFGNGIIRVSVLECNVNPACRVWYDFDWNFTLHRLYASDTFRQFHDEYYRNTRDVHRFTDDEQKPFQKVRCVEGCKTEFVPVHLR